jgi:branched-chain amino acid aminotransferase
MSQLIYVNGELTPVEQATLSVYDHGLLYGDGIYEGIRAYQGRVFQLGPHLDRLWRSAKCLRIALPHDRGELTRVASELLRRNGLTDAYIRLVVTRGPGRLGPDPRSCPRPSVVAIAEPLPPVHGDGAAQRGLRVAIVSSRRDAVDATSHQVKSLNYLNSVQALLEANAAGADEAVMLDRRGFVCESTICNVFLVSRGQLVTPSEASGILRGITRDFVMLLAREQGLPVTERDVTPYELVTADEVFLTGTHAEIVPVTEVNGISIGAGEVGETCTALTRLFREATSDPRHSTPIAEAAHAAGRQL